MRLFVGRRQGRHVREVQIQPPHESFLQIPIYHRRLLTPLRPLQSITFGPHEGGTPHEPCAPGGRPFPNRNSASAAARNPCDCPRNAEKCIYTHVYTSRVESVVFEVLADSTRRRIVETLGAGERPVHALVEAVDIQQSGVSRHLRILHEAGFVRVRAEGQERLYSLCAERFRELDKWMRKYRGLWEARLDRFGAELNRRQKARAGKRRETHS